MYFPLLPKLRYSGRVYPYKYDIYLQKMQWFIHPHSENTKFHRKRKKYLYHLQKAPVPHSGFLRKECCFSLNVVFRTPFYHYLFKKKPSRCFWTTTRQCGMLSARRSTTRAWGCTKHDCLCSRVGLHHVPTHTYVNSWPSCLLQCRTYPGSHESAVHVVMGRGRQSAFVGPFSWLSCARTQVHMFSCLFVRICLQATCSNKIMGIEGIAKWLAHAGLVLRGAHLSSLGGEVCDGWSCASQLHCAESIAAKHARTRLCIHATKASKWPLKHHVTYRLAVAIAGLSWRGGLWCLQLH